MMKKFKTLDMLIAISIIAALILFDLVLKNISYIHHYGKSRVLIKYILEYSYIENDGAAFGILSGKRVLFLFLTLIAVGAFSYLLTLGNFKDKKLYTITFIFLLAGTIGNAIDRISYGFVIDFIVFPFVNKMLSAFRIPPFNCNIADIYLTVGIILFIIDMIMDLVKRKKGKKDPNTILKDNENGENNKENSI